MDMGESPGKNYTFSVVVSVTCLLWEMTKAYNILTNKNRLCNCCDDYLTNDTRAINYQ